MLAAGQAQVLFDQQPDAGPVTLCDQFGHARWHYLWQGNPAIYVPEPPLIPYRKPYLLTGKGHLPYLEYPYSIETGWTFSKIWKAKDHRAKLFLTPDELALGLAVEDQHGPFILLEPPSHKRHVNRRGTRAVWDELAWAASHKGLPYPVVQLDYQDAQLIPGVPAIPHRGFREACGILQSAEVAIMVEGGLAHAAAALAVPSVVVWGGNVSADVLGYPEHLNLVDRSPQTPCGKLEPCRHCADAWDRLTVRQILTATEQALHRTMVH